MKFTINFRRKLILILKDVKLFLLNKFFSNVENAYRVSVLSNLKPSIFFTPRNPHLFTVSNRQMLPTI